MNAAWVSVQTTGLSVDEHVVLSLTILITNHLGQKLDCDHWDIQVDDSLDVDDTILDMHCELIDRCLDSTITLKTAEKDAIAFVRKYGCGGNAAKPNGEGSYKSPLLCRSTTWTKPWLAKNFPKLLKCFARDDLGLSALACLSKGVQLPQATQDGPTDLEALRVWYCQNFCPPMLPGPGAPYPNKGLNRKEVYCKWHPNGMLATVSLTQDGKSLRYVYTPDAEPNTKPKKVAPKGASKKR